MAKQNPPPAWFNERSYVFEQSLDQCPRRQLVIRGQREHGRYFTVTIWQDTPGSDEWLIAAHDPEQKQQKKPAIAYFSLATEELRIAFGLRRPNVSLDKKLEHQFGAQYLIPGKFARTSNYVVLPGPRSNVDLLWPEDVATASIVISPALRDGIRRLIERP